MKRPTALLGAAALLLGALTACGPEDAAGSDGKGLRVVTTTEILADLVRQVGGDRVRVDSIVPPGGDPHSYEPTPRDAAKVAEADVTFTNHLLLEEHALIKTIDANAPEGSPNVSLAEAAEAYGAHVIPLVENIALDKVPDNPAFAFLGPPGAAVHQLPQAVLGKHVHGEIDPHLWQDAENAKAYVQLIRDTLARRDPGGAAAYAENARRYGEELDALDGYLSERIGRIPAERRQLITTHDAFGYLAQAYGLKVAGFVVPNPAQEPSADDVQRLTTTIRNLKLPAVFTEPNLARRAAVLTQVAEDQHVRVCTLYGDAFDATVRHYTDMMRHNGDELLSCLGGGTS
ncbi:metal ABC transporter solute-binding protein, Zn/Mn family [Kitasatospora cineracea]|uniref:metal ABC transporter solute-binding protein, Zn/Mn family n=1 Tax=Kitasatospora cineracea TaxID=88074 RepID=UPI0036B0B0BC